MEVGAQAIIFSAVQVHVDLYVGGIKQGIIAEWCLFCHLQLHLRCFLKSLFLKNNNSLTEV